MVDVAILQAPDHCFGSFQCLLKPAPVKGLQQIVDRVYLESFQGILIVGGYEDHRRHLFSADSFDHFKTIHGRHLDVQENEIGGQLANGANGFVPVGAFADNLNVRIVRQQALDSPASERFIVDD